MRCTPILAAGTLLLPLLAHGETFVVDSLLDGVDANPADGICMTGAGTCTLRAAVQQANARTGFDQIELPAGRIVLARAGAGEDAGATGDLDVTDELSIEGMGRGTSWIDAAGLDRVIDVVEDGTNLTLSDLTLTGGRVEGEDGAGLRGAWNGLLLLLRLAVFDNRALGETDTGGAVYAAPGSALLVYQSSFSTNVADRGGAIFANIETGQILDSTFATNQARAGSAITVYGPCTIERSTFADNEASDNNVVSSERDLLVLRNTTISGNTDPGALVSVTDDLTLEHVTIFDNDAYGAVHASSTGSMEIANSVIVNRVAYLECTAHAGGSIVSLGGNVDSDGSCASGASGDRTLGDPGLGALAPNGGPTLTHLPLPGSPLVDTALASACPAADQRGRPRPEDGDANGSAICDVGAVELAPEPGGAALGLAAGGVLGLRRAGSRFHRRGRRPPASRPARR